MIIIILIHDTHIYHTVHHGFIIITYSSGPIICYIIIISILVDIHYGRFP